MCTSGSGVIMPLAALRAACTARRCARTSRRRAGSSRSAARSPWAGRWCPRCRAARIRCRASRRAGLRRRHGAARHAPGDAAARRRTGDAPRRGSRQRRSAMRPGRRSPGKLAVVEQVVELGGAQVGVDRHHRHAQRVQREPVQEERRPVVQQQPGAMPVAVAGRGIGVAQRLDARRRLAVAAARRRRCHRRRRSRAPAQNGRPAGGGARWAKAAETVCGHGPSHEQLDRRQRRVAVQQVHPLAADAQVPSIHTRSGSRCPPHQLLVAARLDVEERGARDVFVALPRRTISTLGCCST